MDELKPRKCRTGKIRYSDRISALLALSTARTQDDPSRPKIEARAYKCPSCYGWHLTSRAARPE